MLIVITKDPLIVDFYQQAHSGAPAWGPVHILDPTHDQDQATAQLIGLLNNVGAGVPLCIAGHGNDTEVGGKGVGNDTWNWTAVKMAILLSTELQAKPGPILLEVCSDEPSEVDKMQVVGFGTELQREINKLGVSVNLKGTTIYSYHHHISAKHTLPDPAIIDKSIELQGSML